MGDLESGKSYKAVVMGVEVHIASGASYLICQIIGKVLLLVGCCPEHVVFVLFSFSTFIIKSAALHLHLSGKYLPAASGKAPSDWRFVHSTTFLFQGSLSNTRKLSRVIFSKGETYTDLTVYSTLAYFGIFILLATNCLEVTEQSYKRKRQHVCIPDHQERRPAAFPQYGLSNPIEREVIVWFESWESCSTQDRMTPSV